MVHYESMCPFGIGDRVICVEDTRDHNDGVSGKSGTVVEADAESIAVDFDEEVEHGHTCSGTARSHHGWWVLWADCIQESHPLELAEPINIDELMELAVQYYGRNT